MAALGVSRPGASSAVFRNESPKWVSCIVPVTLNCRAQQRRSCGVRSCCPLSVCATCGTDSAENDTHAFKLQRRRSLVVSILLPLLPAITNFDPCSAASAAEEEAVRLEKIRTAVRKGVTKAKAAGVLRLVFHDAGPFNLATKQGGMNGSIVLELERPENQGLNRSIKVLSKVKAALEPDVEVSWADLIAVAGAEAVSICGGPKIDVKLGRVDSSLPDPEGQMPEENLTGSQLREAFQAKGFSTQELVALSGAHSVGGKGFGDPYTFDNIYYKILLDKPWLAKGNESSMIGLDSDRALPEDEECLKWVNAYAQNQDLFFQDFTNAYMKLVDTGVQRLS
ncbi:hypothetical protein Mapa_014274 [Marchantia paleacea]|nr:hypothetical protein Mapa_014274 [Marchantia paleacea]